MVKVKFTKNYIASRGPGISGRKDDEKEYRMTDALQARIDDGTLKLVKGKPAAKREKATGKKGAESS
jgi:hypothetical protein